MFNSQLGTEKRISELKGHEKILRVKQWAREVGKYRKEQKRHKRQRLESFGRREKMKKQCLKIK